MLDKLIFGAGKTWCLFIQDQEETGFEKNVHLASSVGNSVTTDAAKRHDESRPKDCAHRVAYDSSGLVANVLLVVVSFLDLIQRHHVSNAQQILLQIFTK